MSKLLMSLLSGAVLALQAQGQGSLMFDTLNPRVLAPVTISTAPGTFYPADGPPGAYVGSNYTASLFWLGGIIADQAVFDSLNPMWAVDASFFGTTGTGISPGPSVDGSGFFDGGLVRFPQVGYVTVQVRVWYNGGGVYSSYTQSKAAGHNAGESNLLPLVVTAPPGPASNLEGLLPFTVGIPEPSTFVLAALGGALLLLFRRRRR